VPPRPHAIGEQAGGGKLSGENVEAADSDDSETTLRIRGQ
jgi:hypothetical protein